MNKRSFLKTGIAGLACMAPFAHAASPVEPSLWSVQGTNGAQNWVLGTVETPLGFVAPFKPEVEPALQASKIIGTQYLGDINSVLERAKLMLGPKPSLLETLGEADYQRLLPLLLQRGYPEYAVAKLHPWATGMLLLTPAIDPGQVAMDASLIQYSLETQKQYFGVLSIAQQVAPFEGLQMAQQVALLRALVNKAKPLEALFAKNIQAYMAGRVSQVKLLGALATLLPLAEQKAWFGQWQSQLTQARVHAITSVLHAPLREGGVFVGLDCELLIGKGRVLASLAHMGFRVQPAAVA